MMQIMEDLTPITLIQTMGDEGSSWIVGKEGVTKIVPYHESGQLFYAAWFAVYEDNEIVQRINGAAVEYISYR